MEKHSKKRASKVIMRMLLFQGRKDFGEPKEKENKKSFIRRF